jgi:hypothetical protein
LAMSRRRWQPPSSTASRAGLYHKPFVVAS